jgi:hypothetical protein
LLQIFGELGRIGDEVEWCTQVHNGRFQDVALEVEDLAPVGVDVRAASARCTAGRRHHLPLGLAL